MNRNKSSNITEVMVNVAVELFRIMQDIRSNAIRDPAINAVSSLMAQINSGIATHLNIANTPPVGEIAMLVDSLEKCTFMINDNKRDLLMACAGLIENDSQCQESCKCQNEKEISPSDEEEQKKEPGPSF